MAGDGSPVSESFIPDLCHARAVLTIIVLGEVLALILCLGPGARMQDFLFRFAVTSLLVQWVALVSALLLCNLRGLFSRLGNPRGGVLAFLIMQLVTLLFSYSAFLVFSPHYFSAAEMGTQIGRNLLLSALISAVLLRFFFLQHQVWLNLTRENQAQLQSLQARIRPHFLFNSLNTIANLVPTMPDVAEEALLNLADLFRANLVRDSLLVPFREERELCGKYLHIEEQRLGPRLRVYWEVDRIPDQVLIPSLLLQPLLENAIYHGIEPLAQGGAIHIRGWWTPDGVDLRIENPLPDQEHRGRQPGHRLAVDNVQQRLRRHFGDSGKLRAIQTDKLYTVVLQFPGKRQDTG